MGLLQAAYRTYETQAARAGVPFAGEKEPLTPLSHMMANAHIEITLNMDGHFQSAVPVPKEDCKTIIPVTVESANRTSKNTKAHPLCDQLRYLAPFGGEKFAAYLEQLNRWADSPFSHPKLLAIRQYIAAGSIVRDLAAAGVITLDENGNPGNGKIEGIPFDKCLVRWRVVPAPEGESTACWRDKALFSSFSAFYAHEREGEEQDLCMITGAADVVCDMHPKGVLAYSNGAKLISSNDSNGFTYRGRFTQSKEAVSVGYDASQKAHSALRWLTVNHGAIFGGRTFLCWNPEGASVPSFAVFGFSKQEKQEKKDFVSYRDALKKTIGGYRQALRPEADVVVAALDAATTGRLSVTYYNQLMASDFLARIERWYETCCWDSRRFGVQAPPLKRIVDCAFGTERTQFFETDGHVLREQIQRLLPCILDERPVPKDIVRALVNRAGTPLAYQGANRETLLEVTCALVRKDRHDDKKEEWKLALDTSSTNRSYLFGRLLAVAEQVERATYDREEKRDPNAIRMQAVFAQRPLYAWRIIEEKLNPYYARLKPGLRAYFKNLVGEILDKLPEPDDPTLPQRLEDVYLLGYYQQRTALTRKKENTVTEEKNDEYSEQQD